MTTGLFYVIFVKNDNYFNGTIYQTTQKTEEPEKFAFFSKAVYELMKAKEDITSVKDIKIANREAFDAIKSPDAPTKTQCNQIDK